MSLEEIGKTLKRIDIRIREEAEKLHKRIAVLDAKVDPVVESVKKSKLTPVWVALLAVLCFAAGIWVGGLF